MEKYLVDEIGLRRIQGALEVHPVISLSVFEDMSSNPDDGFGSSELIILSTSFSVVGERLPCRVDK